MSPAAAAPLTIDIIMPAFAALQLNMRGKAFDNLLALAEMSNCECSQMTDAFAAVRLLQRLLAHRQR